MNAIRENEVGMSARARRRARRGWMVAAGLVALTGCSGAAGAGAGAGEAVGTASLAITDAPADGTCIQVTAFGDRTVVKSFDVPAGSSTVLQLDGLPLGTVVFSAVAFGGTCEDVGDAAVPSWVSQSDTETVAVFPPVAVKLQMVHTGEASVSIDFSADADAGPPPKGTDGGSVPPQGWSIVSNVNDVNPMP